jgi:hypothetical protein
LKFFVYYVVVIKILNYSCSHNPSYFRESRPDVALINTASSQLH